MLPLLVSLASAAGRTGRGVRIAVVDSGIHASHPHVGGIAGGVVITEHGPVEGSLVDRLGHGTAVAAAIREKAPDAALLAVKIFDQSLAATGRALAEAIRWSADQQSALINLSLGTANEEHRALLERAVEDARVKGAIVVAAAPQPEANWLPGALATVVAVTLDWGSPRHACAIHLTNGRVRIEASGFPRPIPGVAPADNVKGVSFAVANATGLLALALEDGPVTSLDGLIDRCRSVSRSMAG